MSHGTHRIIISLRKLFPAGRRLHQYRQRKEYLTLNSAFWTVWILCLKWALPSCKQLWHLNPILQILMQHCISGFVFSDLIYLFLCGLWERRLEKSINYMVHLQFCFCTKRKKKWGTTHVLNKYSLLCTSVQSLVARKSQAKYASISPDFMFRVWKAGISIKNDHYMLKGNCLLEIMTVWIFGNGYINPVCH